MTGIFHSHRQYTVPLTAKESATMTPFIIGLAASGGILFWSAVTGKGNETAIKIAMEGSKLGFIWYVLQRIHKIFM
jgi:hypothetical protein